MKFESTTGVAAIALLSVASDARAHINSADGVWSLDWLALACIAIAAVAYALGTARLARLGRKVRVWEVGYFGAGSVALFLSLVWPLEALSQRSFAAHMTQHLLLIAVAPPLLVLGASLPVFAALRLPRAVIARVPWARFARPVPAFTLHSVVVWIWHAPGLFQSAVESYYVHFFEHATLFITGLFFWWALLFGNRQRSAGAGTGALFALLMIMHMGILGALLTFAPNPLYPIYADRARSLGLRAIEDQQLAGLIMWIPGAFIYLAAGLGLVALWLRNAERRARLMDEPLSAPQSWR